LVAEDGAVVANLKWDYTALAPSYVMRPDYAADAIDALCALTGARPGHLVCDVGAGVGHLTLPLLDRGLTVDAVEPNDAMRAIGRGRTADRTGVAWFDGTGEATGRPAGRYDLVTFGSSFNVTDRSLAMVETARIGKPGAWFACMWNHRDLEDPFQAEVEAMIHALVPDYDYGTRREDQTAVIEGSGLFGPVERIDGRILHTVPAADWVRAWESHATLQRQAGDRLPDVLAAIGDFVANRGLTVVVVPYTTRIWAARLRAD
jgi:SAM-dependent methyltransferase